jgi:hypothetical protein
LTSLFVALAACGGGADPATFDGPGGPGAVDRGKGAPPLGASSPDPCDGFDNNGSGEVDEGCSCTAGQTQRCFPGPPAKAGVGACKFGTQRCVAGGEFGHWGPCEGAVGPKAEICGNGIDEDCDGKDLACSGGPGTGPGGGPGGADGGGPSGGGSPDGGSAPPGTVDVNLFLLGDCITASCPPSAPYPISCNVVFSPGDSRGCVASTPTSSVVYFQAGDQCDKGLITGTMRCSVTPGPALSAANCPINKPVPIYATSRTGCPAVH